MLYQEVDHLGNAFASPRKGSLPPKKKQKAHINSINQQLRLHVITIVSMLDHHVDDLLGMSAMPKNRK
jgi:hypothetical protein